MNRPRVLWVTSEPPNERLGGGSVRQSHLLRRLGRLADVDLLVLGTATDEHVRASVRSVTEVTDPGLPRRTAGARDALWRLRVLVLERSTAGIDAERRRARTLLDRMRTMVPGHDVVVVVHEALADAVPTSRSQRWILQLHHVAAERSAQAAAAETRRRRRLAHRVEAHNGARWIRRHGPRWDAVVTVSARDGHDLALEPAKVRVVPNGVDLTAFRPTLRPTDGPVVMTGSLDYPPNVDGARWFVERVWPAIRRQRPESRLQLVGRSPTPAVLALRQHAGVSVHADVDDVRPWLEGASAVVVPLRIGTGTRVKALEAMAAGRPVVGTTVGLESLDLRPGHHALVADRPGDFAAAVVSLLDDAELADRLATAGRAHVEARFGWDSAVDRLLSVLSERDGSRTGPSLTGLVCTRDRSELVPPALHSLAAALGPADELIVVEHGAEAAATATSSIDAACTVLRSARPGKSRQLNIGVTAARGDVLVCTDDDCRVDPTWARAMAAPFQDPAVGAVFGPVVGLDGAGSDPGPAALRSGLAPDRTWRFANGAAMALRRDAVLAVGGFDERLGPGAPLHGEEHDVVLRLREAGWEIRIADAPPVRHVEWRTPAERQRNLEVYSRGAGGFLGAAVRRAPRRWLRLLIQRGRYQLRLWTYWREEGLLHGPRTTLAFLGGLVAGVRLAPRRWL